MAVDYKQDETERMNLADMDNEAFQKLLRDKVAGGISGKGSKQRIVSVDEIEKYLSKGFEFKSVLPNGRAIMKMPFLKI